MTAVPSWVIWCDFTGCVAKFRGAEEFLTDTWAAAVAYGWTGERENTRCPAHPHDDVEVGQHE